MVLLDELEKAHPDVFNILLQVLEDGRLTDGQGRTVDFTNTVLIMTSNIPGEPIDHFKPEFVNRIDEIVRFHPLTQADLARIVTIQLAGLRGRLAERRLTLSVTPAAEALLAKEGFDPDFGARPLRRVIQRQVEDPLALALLEGRYPEGSTVTVDEKDGAIVLVWAPRSPPASLRGGVDARKSGCRIDPCVGVDPRPQSRVWLPSSIEGAQGGPGVGHVPRHPPARSRAVSTSSHGQAGRRRRRGGPGRSVPRSSADGRRGRASVPGSPGAPGCRPVGRPACLDMPRWRMISPSGDPVRAMAPITKTPLPRHVVAPDLRQGGPDGGAVGSSGPPEQRRHGQLLEPRPTRAVAGSRGARGAVGSTGGLVRAHLVIHGRIIVNMPDSQSNGLLWCHASHRA